MNDQTDPRRDRAKRHVAALRSFYSNLFAYLLINGVLIIWNLITSPGNLWFYWVTIGWGIGLAFHAFSVFGRSGVLGPDWEEKKINEYMEKDKG
jgi:hypothetical protein